MPFKRSNYTAARFKSKPSGWLQAKSWKRNPKLQVQQAAKAARSAMVQAAANVLQRRLQAAHRGKKTRKGFRGNQRGYLTGGRFTRSK